MRLVTLRHTNTRKTIGDRKEHAREAARLRSLAATVTTAAAKARIFAQVQEHARLAGLAEGELGY